MKPLSHRPVGNGTRATAINNKGQFVGATTVDDPSADLPVHAFLWVGGKPAGHMKDLGTLLSFRHSLATALNERGQIVGYTSTMADAKLTYLWRGRPGGARAFLWSHGKMRALGTLRGGDFSMAFGINNAGQVVGASDTPGKTHNLEEDHAFLWQKGWMYDINELLPPDSGWTLETASAINNRGQIVGNGLYMGESHAFLLTPQ